MNKLNDFFDALWRDEEGYRVVSRKTANGFNNFYCKDNADALQEIERIRDENADCYYAVHLFGSENRKSESAIGCRALYLDIDAKDYAGGLEDAKTAIDKFIADAGLSEPIRICSGNGYHLIWIFNQMLSESVWSEAARQLRALCFQYELEADKSVTTDNARVLRVPETFNYKDASNPKKCELITEIYTYDFAEIKQALEKAENQLPNFKDALSVNDLFAGGIENKFADNPQESREIARLCLAHLSPERCEDYDGWINVGLALGNVFAGENEGLTLWDGWSKASGKYKANECADRWQGFGERFDGDKLQVGSLISWAREDSAEFCQIWEKRVEEKRVERLAAKSSEIQLTDYGNAQRLIALHGEKIRYDYERKIWFVWNGKFWQENAEAKVIQFAKATAKAMYKEASQIQDDSRRQTLAKHAIKSESANSLRAMVKLAESEAEILADVSEFDTQPNLLNVANGVIDLQSGRLLPHTREMMLTNYVPIEYNPNAKCPIFEAFLERIFAGNRDLIKYVHRAVGYTATGETREQCYFIAYGTGANGKSTLFNVIEYILGDAASCIRTEALMRHKLTSHSGHNEDVANLCGKRFVSAVETESGQHLAESSIKQLTGGDTITASRKYGQSFNFKPQFKLWIAANHKPEISGTDNGIWRRTKLIPFNVQIPESEQDKNLDKKLQSEASGILAWIVRGAVAWYASGLGNSDEIERATSAYRNEQDSVLNFFAEFCEIGKEFSIKPSVLYENYKLFCGESGYAPLNQQEFPRRLAQLGYSKNDSRMWQGIKIKTQAVFPDSRALPLGNHGNLQAVG